MKYWLAVVLLSLSLQLFAEETIVDISEVKQSADKSFFESKAFDILEVGTPLVLLGFAVKPACEEFQNIRNSYCGDVRFYADDYLQYSPAFLMLGLKVAGVESRSSWGRMTVSGALSGAMMAIMVNSVKRTVGVNRPYSNSNSSMPSGHTATAFMAASLLHKEYGMVSPWYSIAGYSLATTAGVMRVINNQHWMSDVLVGAGIGILGTEIGYLLGDLIYKDRGINRYLDDTFNAKWDNTSSRASLGLNLSIAVPLNQLSSTVKTNMGAKVGVEGFYLFNDRFGVGATAAVSEYSLDLNGVLQEQSLDVMSTGVGGFYAQPISQYWRVGARVLAGMDYYKECLIGDDLNIGKGARAAFGGGFSLEYISNRHWTMKILCDYNAACMSELPKTKLHQTAMFGVAGNIIF